MFSIPEPCCSSARAVGLWSLVLRVAKVSAGNVVSQDSTLSFPLGLWFLVLQEPSSDDSQQLSWVECATLKERRAGCHLVTLLMVEFPDYVLALLSFCSAISMTLGALSGPRFYLCWQLLCTVCVRATSAEFLARGSSALA